MNQDELKALVGQAALKYVLPGGIIGIGTGSTVNFFLDALACMKDAIKGAVSSSTASTARLQALGIRVFEANEVGAINVDLHCGAVAEVIELVTLVRLRHQQRRLVCLRGDAHAYE